MRRCLNCFYYGGRTKTCDFYLYSGVRRNSDPENCSRYKDRRDKRTIVFARPKANVVAQVPEDKQSLVLELYRQGLVDVEIACKLGLHPQAIHNWRRSHSLVSNYLTKGDNDESGNFG